MLFEIHTATFILFLRSIAMSGSQQTTVFATNVVLDRFGKEVAEILRKYLRENFAICFEPDCMFAIEELGIAVQRLLGVEVANMLMRDIRDEIEGLKPAFKVQDSNLTYWQIEETPA